MPQLDIYSTCQSPGLWFVIWDNGVTVEKSMFQAVLHTDAWAKRRPWTPSPAQQRHVCTEANRNVISVMHYFQAAGYGIPRGVHEHLNWGQLLSDLKSPRPA